MKKVSMFSSPWWSIMDGREGFLGKGDVDPTVSPTCPRYRAVTLQLSRQLKWSGCCSPQRQSRSRVGPGSEGT